MTTIRSATIINLYGELPPRQTLKTMLMSNLGRCIGKCQIKPEDASVNPSFSQIFFSTIGLLQHYTLMSRKYFTDKEIEKAIESSDFFYKIKFNKERLFCIPMRHNFDLNLIGKIILIALGACLYVVALIKRMLGMQHSTDKAIEMMKNAYTKGFLEKDVLVYFHVHRRINSGTQNRIKRYLEEEYFSKSPEERTLGFEAMSLEDLKLRKTTILRLYARMINYGLKHYAINDFEVDPCSRANIRGYLGFISEKIKEKGSLQ